MRIPSKSERSDNSNATNDASKLDETKTGPSKQKETYTASSWRKDRKKSSSGSSSKLNEDDDPFFNDDDFDDDDDNDGILGMEFGLLSAKKSKRKSKHFSTPDAVQTKTIASLNRSGGQTAAINAKIKGAMRVLVPCLISQKICTMKPQLYKP